MDCSQIFITTGENPMELITVNPTSELMKVALGVKGGLISMECIH